jgi:hypothetical protein
MYILLYKFYHYLALCMGILCDNMELVSLCYENTTVQQRVFKIAFTFN